MYSKTYFTFLTISLFGLISACTSQPEPNSTLAPNPLATETLTPEPSSTWTPEPSATAAFTATPTPVPVLISLTEYGGHGADEFISCLRAFGEEHLLLYEDGLLIKFGFSIEFGVSYTSAQLSQEEIDALLKEIEETGFFEVEGTGRLGDDDPIYDFEGENTIASGWGSSINVLGKEVNIEDPLYQYLIEPVRDTHEILRSYRHEDEVPYKPNRLGTFVLLVDEEYLETYDLKELYNKEPVGYGLIWPDALPPITSLLEDYLVYFEGEELNTLLEIFPKVPSYGVFYEGNVPFLVFACFPEK